MDHDADAQQNQPSADDLQSYFDRCAAVVLRASDRFERDYARPAVQLWKAWFERRPITTTFLTVFAAQSLIPILFFIFSSAFAIATFTGLALTCACVASAAFVAFCGTILLLTLFTLLIFLLTVTLLGGGLYLSALLPFLAFTEGKPGLIRFYERGRESVGVELGWRRSVADGFRERGRSGSPFQIGQGEEKKVEKQEDEASEGSEVVVSRAKEGEENGREYAPNVN